MGQYSVPKIAITFTELPIAKMPDSFWSVYAYWNALRGDRFAPHWREFDMMQIPAKLLPSTLVKDVERVPLDFRFRYYGSQYGHLRNREYTGKTVGEMQGDIFSSAMTASLRSFIKQKHPVYYTIDKLTNHQSTRIQTQLRLPVSNDGTSVTTVISLVDIALAAFDYVNLELDGKALPYFGHT